VPLKPDTAQLKDISCGYEGEDRDLSVRSALVRGQREMKRKEYGHALCLFHLAAMRGSPEALRWIPWIYYNGLGVERDYHEAFRWCEFAALRDDPDAENALG